MHNKTGIKRIILTTQQNNTYRINPITRPIINNTNTNKLQINKYYTIIENKIITTTTVICNQTIGAITPILVLYTLVALIVVVNIITISKEPQRHIN